jgi:hypothetical protein
MSKFTLVWITATALLVLTFQAAPAAGQPLPVHAGTRILRSGSLVVEVGDPESAECRWNKGLRFSPVANVLRAQLDGREFLYSPVNGGALTYLGGLPMEFDIGQEAFQPDPPGYNEGNNGAPFLKIGVGILRRNASAYNFSSNYPVVELAHTTVTWQEDRAHFVQTLTGSANGYSCHLEEDLIVKNDRIIMKYRLQNTGTKTFTTEQYLHNFLCFSYRSVGPNVRLSFPYDFTTSPTVTPWQPPARVRPFAIAAAPTVVRIANMIEYMETVSSVPKIWVYKPEGYVGPERFAVEHLDTQQRMVIETSIPAAYVGIWTTNYQVSPEQFVLITLAPDEEIEFTRTYIFQIDDFVPQDCTGDAAVDANDLSRTSAAWLSEPGGARWEPACDISSPPDDKIDLHDLTALADQWRQAGGLPEPVAHWRFDETAGTAASDERGQHAGTLRNFPSDGSQWVTGADGGGLLFDGIDNSVDIAGYAGITGKHPRTVTAWIRLGEKPLTNQGILAWGEQTPGRYWLLEVDTNRRLRFSCGEGDAVAAGRLVGDMQWHHIAVALDPMVADDPHVSDIRLYVDTRPQPLYEMTEHEINTGNAEPVRIGASHDPNETSHFNGIIDDVRIYDAALDAAHVLRVYREAIPE